MSLTLPAFFFASMHICHIRRMGREVYSSQVAQEGGKESCNILEMCCYVMQYTDILTYVNTILSHKDLATNNIPFQNEAMTGTHTQNPIYSRITMALMEDTG